MDSSHHQLDDTVQQLLSLLSIAATDQLGGPDDIGEQHRDLLALALKRAGVGPASFGSEARGGAEWRLRGDDLRRGGRLA